MFVLVPTATHLALVAKLKADIQNIFLSFAPNKTFLQNENNSVLCLSVGNCLPKVGGP
jgi:hypothetical protein